MTDDASERPRIERIGDFRILRVLGEGGMGVVYEAEQDNPRRRVALKIVRSARMNPEIVKRFEREAHVLGLLQHPGIAQVYHAGTADTGAGPQPYFAMELVNGRPLSDYVREQKLDTRQRMELLARICEALDHAHQKGVIHRDLKPGNILVVSDAATSVTTSASRATAGTRLDDVAHVGQPKILDFGIARLVESDLPEQTLQTAVGQVLGTVQYMSPEQITGNSAQVDAKSDVYALGVIGFELVCDRLPYELRGVGMLEAARVIEHVEPRAASTIDKKLRGDIETILAKALEKEPARRYASAAEMAADIRRYLRDEPIVARPASTAYQLKKFAARNKVLVGGIAAVFVALVIGLVGTAMGYVEARRNEELARARGEDARLREQEAVKARDEARVARDLATAARDEATTARDEATAAKAQADAAAAEAEAINKFLVDDLLSKSDPSESKGRTITLDEVLENAREHADQVFQDKPLLSARLHSTLGTIEYHMGHDVEAERHFRTAWDIRRDKLGAEAFDTLDTQSNLATMLRQLDRFTEALELERTTAEAWRRKNDERNLASSLYRIGQIQSSMGDASGAMESYDEALARLRALPEDQRDSRDTLPALLTDRATVLSSSGRDSEARTDYESALALYLEREGELHPDALRVKAMLAGLTRTEGDLRGALEEYQDVLAAERQVFKRDHPDIAQTLGHMGQTATDLGEYAQALEWLEESLAMRDRLGQSDDATACLGRVKLARVLNALGRPKEGAVQIERAVATLESRPDSSIGSRADAQFQLALTRRALGDFEGTAQAAKRALELRRSMAEPDPLEIVQAMSMVAQSYHSLKQYDEAEPLYREVLELYSTKEGPRCRNVAIAYANLGGLSLDRKRDGEALEQMQKAVEIAAETYPPDHPDLAYIRSSLARALRRTGAMAEAIEILRGAVEVQRAKLPPGHTSTLTTLVDLGEALTESGSATEAEPILREAVEGRRSAGGANGAKFARAAEALAACLIAQDRREEAESVLLESQAAWAGVKSEPQAAAKVARQLVELYTALGRPEDAASWSERATAAQ